MVELQNRQKGIDVFFDNVGGEILDHALARLALRGRVVLCGAISRYSDDRPAPGPRNYMNLVVKRGRMEGQGSVKVRDGR